MKQSCLHQTVKQPSAGLNVSLPIFWGYVLYIFVFLGGWIGLRPNYGELVLWKQLGKVSSKNVRSACWGSLWKKEPH